MNIQDLGAVLEALEMAQSALTVKVTEKEMADTLFYLNYIIAKVKGDIEHAKAEAVSEARQVVR